MFGSPFFNQDGVQHNGEVKLGAEIYKNRDECLQGIVENYLTAYGFNPTEIIRKIAAEESLDELTDEFFNQFMPPEKVDAIDLEREEVKTEIEKFLAPYRG